MASIQYDVVYVARSPANTRQEDFAAQVDEICNGRAARGWKLMSTVGDYGAKVTLGVWLYFSKEGDDLDSFGAGGGYEEEPLGSTRPDEGMEGGESGGGYGGDEGGSGEGGFGGDEAESGGEDLGGGSDEEPA